MTAPIGSSPLERLLYIAALAVCTILIIVTLCGCGPTLRTTVAATTASAELAAKVTGDVCTLLAKQLCKTNPCPDLDRCHQAERLITQSAVLLTEGAKLVNELPQEVTDAAR